MKRNAIVITGGFLQTNQAKTAHGLIRGSDRFNIIAVIDEKGAGKDAGELLDGRRRDIPVFSSVADFVNTGKEEAQYCIIGVATKGGVIPESLQVILKDALLHGLGIVNGLHTYVSEIPELANLAREKEVEVIDVRKPKKNSELHFWSGKILEVKCPKVAVLGTDCALGKRTTTRMLVHAMNEAGYKAEMIYTGQTGWMQGAKYGFIFDSTLNDFVSGELEHAVYTCYQETNPDIIFIEGQSSLRNPSGPAGAEWIVSANASAVVLQHDPGRKHYKDMEKYPALIADVREEIDLIRMYGAPTIAVTINTGTLSEQEARNFAREYEEHLQIPFVLPLEDGVDKLVPYCEELIRESRNSK